MRNVPKNIDFLNPFPAELKLIGRTFQIRHDTPDSYKILEQNADGSFTEMSTGTWNIGKIVEAKIAELRGECTEMTTFRIELQSWLNTYIGDLPKVLDSSIEITVAIALVRKFTSILSLEGASDRLSNDTFEDENQAYVTISHRLADAATAIEDSRSVSEHIDVIRAYLRNTVFTLDEAAEIYINLTRAAQTVGSKELADLAEEHIPQAAIFEALKVEFIEAMNHSLVTGPLMFLNTERETPYWSSLRIGLIHFNYGTLMGNINTALDLYEADKTNLLGWLLTDSCELVNNWLKPYVSKVELATLISRINELSKP